MSLRFSAQDVKSVQLPGAIDVELFPTKTSMSEMMIQLTNRLDKAGDVSN